MLSLLKNPIKILLLIVVFLNWSSFCLAGFGVSPPKVSEHRLIKGSHLERTVYLVRGDPKEDVDIEIIIDSPKIKEWISFDVGENVVLPAGIQQFPLNIIIDVPAGAELGIYKAFVRVNTKPKPAEESGSVSIALGGRIEIDLTVGDDIFADFNVRGIRILDIKEHDPLKVSVSIENIGNVPIGPDRISFELFNKYGDIRLAYTDVSNIPEVAAFKTDDIVIEFPLDIKLGVGEYWGTVKIYKGEQVFRELKTVFRVHPKTFSEKYGLHLKFIAIILIVIVLFVFFLVRNRKKKK